MVNIDPARAFGGAFQDFLDKIDPKIAGKLDETVYYKVAIASLGGKISARKDSAELLRDPQYMGNCGTASLMAILDKAFVSASLAARMSSLTLYRTTQAYYKANLANFQAGEERESRRTLLMIGTQAALESIQNAIETGGLIGEEATELLEGIKKIQKHVVEWQNSDFGALKESWLTFQNYKEVTVQAPSFEKSIIEPPPKSAFPISAIPAKLPQQVDPIEPAGNSLPPIKNLAFEKLLRFINAKKSDPLALNQAAILTPLDLDEIFQLGFEDSRSLTTAMWSSNLPITENLALFSWGDLLDKDRLGTLQTLVLDQKALARNIAHDPGLIQSIGEFCNNGLKLGRGFGLVSTESYFAYLIRTVEQSLKEVAKTPGITVDLTAFPKAQDVFAQLVDSFDPLENKDRLKVIHYDRVKSFEMHKQLTVEETGELLSSVNFLKTRGFPKETQGFDAHFQKIWKLAEKARSHFNSPESVNIILNRIARDTDRAHTPCQWSLHPVYHSYVNTAETISYDPETGLVTRLTLGKKTLPDVLVTDPLFLDIVGKTDILLDRFSDTTFIYQDPAGVNYRFSIQGEKVETLREFRDQWYYALSPSEGIELPTAPVGAHRGLKGGILWAPLEKAESLFYSAPGGQHLVEFYQKKDKKNQSLLSRIGDWFSKDPLSSELLDKALQKTGMKLVDPKSSRLDGVISRIEDPKFTLSFVEDGKLAKVVFPRLGLEFTRSKDKVLVASQLDGFGLAEGAQVIPVLGDFKHYLPLKKIDNSGNEERGVIIPLLPFAEELNQSLATKTALVPPGDNWGESVPYFFYRFRGNTLEPEVDNSFKAVQANLHLVTIFLSERRYDEATKYLQTADSLLKSMGVSITKEIQNQLLQLVKFSEINHDLSPEAAALRLRAGATLQRLISLSQAQPAVIPCKDDYRLYRRHINRISAKLRLSKEEGRHISEAAAARALPIASAYSYPIAHSQDFLEHPPLTIADYNKGIVEPANEPHKLPKMAAGDIVTSQTPVFIYAFPLDILPLYSLLKNPIDIGKAQRQQIAAQFGLDPEIDSKALKATCVTLLEMRYRYLARADSLPNEMRSEMNLLQALIRVGQGEYESEDLPLETERYQKLAGSVSVMPDLKVEANAYKQVMGALNPEVQKEALRLWRLWVTPKAIPLVLSIDRADEPYSSFIGPVFIKPLLKLQPEIANPQAFETSYAAANINRPSLFLYNSPVMANPIFDSIFASTTVEPKPLSSPFQASSENKMLAKVFAEYETRYQEYKERVHLKSPPQHYTLLKKDLLIEQKKLLSAQKSLLEEEMNEYEKLIIEELNSPPKDPSVRLHTQVRLARGVARPLTLNDAKAALAKGWDIKHLHDLNPNLSVEDVKRIFEMTTKHLLDKRNVQRYERTIKAISAVLTADPKEPTWQFLIQNLKNAGSEKTHYDPYNHPTLLLAETEFDIALWKEQIPAITRLAPRKQISALVELAMGLGKTDVISPTVLTMLADGETLVVYVTLDQLKQSVSGRLQQRMLQGYNKEIRSIPIERDNWTAEKINKLTDELGTMVEQRVPLTWSSTDIQTLINSFIEDSNEAAGLDAAMANEKMKAWQRLFQFLKTRAEIIGDEIHAILDILTSYNFSSGISRSMDKDEMDAVADFMKLFMQHPDVINQMSLSFMDTKGTTPLTEDFFRQSLVPKLVDSIIERGIIDDPRAKELLEGMDQARIAHIRDYLTCLPAKAEQKITEIRFFPKLDIEKQGKPAVLGNLLESDRYRLKSIKDEAQFRAELKKVVDEYARLDARLYNFLAVQKESLRVVFALTATAQIGKHYVMNLEENGAIPADNGTPLWDSQFGSTLERLYYTLFLFAHNPLKREVLEKDLIAHTIKYREKLNKFFDQPSTMRKFDPNLFKDEEFESLYGSILRLKEDGFSDLEIDQATAYINQKFERKIELIRKYIFPEQKVFPKEIETSTHFFPLIAKPGIGLKGMSGTTYNEKTYPHVYGAKFDSDTTFLVTERIKSVASVNTIQVPFKSDTEQLIRDIYANSPLGAGSIIDTTGYLRKEHTEDYARLMLEQIAQKDPEINGLVFYNKDTPMVLRRGIHKPSLYSPSLPQKKLAALWDVAHTTGSNILVKPSAHAFLIAGQHIRLFELTQAAMRLRGLGSGQKLEIVVLEQDRIIIAAKLKKYLGIAVDEKSPLSVDHIIQYALLNEFLGETENNWRAIDMRMRVAILEPVMNLIWNETTQPEKAREMFDIVKGIFSRDRKTQPWEMYGVEVYKEDTAASLAKLLESWKTHPILEAIKQKPQLFPSVDVDIIKKRLDSIAAADSGPLPPQVDSESYLGKRTRDKTHTNVKSNVRVKLQEKEKTREIPNTLIKQRVALTDEKRLPVKPLKRQPYQPLPVIPLPENVFQSSSYVNLPLKEATKLTIEQLQPKEMAARKSGAAISSSEWLGIDPSLKQALKLNDDDISISMNLAPVWIDSEGTAPLYAPYSFFQKLPSHALLIHNKKTNTVKLRLVDANEADAIAQKLAEDRKDPSKAEKHEVNLTLYHLAKNLSEDPVIASGAIPVNPNKKEFLKNSIVELIAKAKLLSGFIDYTKEESTYLVRWLQQERDPKAILEKFLFQISLYREQTLHQFFPDSPLAQIFKDCGIKETDIQMLINDPAIKHAHGIHKVLFDRTLDTPEKWIKAASEIPATRDYAAQWSNAAVPLIPIRFEMPKADGAAAWKEPNLLESRAKEAFQRRWFMNEFYPNVADEFGAWTTAVPSLRGYQPGPGVLSQMMNARTNYGKDVDEAFLQNALKSLDKAPPKPAIANVDQLETVSDLAHPIWGLPLISGSSGQLSTVSKALGATSVFNTDDLRQVRQQALAVPSGYQDLAQSIAQRALENLDLPASLKALASKDPNYPFERLYGTFAFLGKQGVNAKARRQYALHMLPRLYEGSFGPDMRFYTSFIPDNLTVETAAYTSEEINKLLTSCHKAALNKGLHWQTASSDTEPNSKELSLALQGIAKNAPPAVAKVTAEWINGHLSKDLKDFWWFDTLLFQVMSRHEPIVEHAKYADYFAQGNSQSHMQRAFDYEATQSLTQTDIDVLKTWKINDFDLFADLAEMKTANQPVLSTYQRATKWANALKNITPQRDITTAKNLCKRILGPIAKEVQVSPPIHEADKKALRDLLEVFDRFSLAQASNDNFIFLQNELGNIRLAANYGFEQSVRRDFALEELAKLPNKNSSLTRIFEHFIPNFLLKDSETATVQPAAIKKLFSELAAIDNNIDYWNEFFTRHLSRFTLSGTAIQQTALTEWVNAQLKVKAKAPGSMREAILFQAMNNLPRTINHADLISYYSGKGMEAITHIGYYAPKAIVTKPEGYIFKDDLELFAEIVELTTANRPPLPYDIYATKLAHSINNNLGTYNRHELLPMFKRALTAIHQRAERVPEVSRNKVALSGLLEALEKEYETRFDDELLDQANEIRLLSDYFDPKDPHKNIQKAAVDIFKYPTNSFRSKSLQKLLPQLKKQTTDEKGSNLPLMPL